MEKFIIYFLVFLSLVLHVSAATVHGNVYDISLNKVAGARIEINTTPKQQIISVDGSYSFEIPNGFYSLKASLYENNLLVASEEENVTIRRAGDFVIDMILFPNLDYDALLEEPDFDVELDEEKNGKWKILFFSFPILFIIISFVYLIKKNKDKNNTENQKADGKISQINSKKEPDIIQEDNYNLDNIISTIKEEGGRTTQKDIRKKIPYSEAKISLMIAELEHKGIIEKIKKGRGNIIILKK